MESYFGDGLNNCTGLLKILSVIIIQGDYAHNVFLRKMLIQFSSSSGGNSKLQQLEGMSLNYFNSHSTF